MVLAGRPDNDSFVSDLQGLEGEMNGAAQMLHFPKCSDIPRRGTYLSMSMGISYGGGGLVSPTDSRTNTPEPTERFPGPW